ncbi:DUF1275 domain-containing protein [Sneathiella chungangensis]|uniref:DUF1275 domain-containing protein n=1 Tax=Sneathiella chungangensis TaxID=1418234 RepID=A0A845MN54_9PROT|nr:YoaK family protein [Sneathiella chungangensis]MZR23904.1 DUF1275 domain-containing protein [Sneathiella chungangensis]
MAGEQQPSQSSARLPTDQHIPILLSFISAFVDVICYLGLFRTFTAFITGTLIILAAETIHPDGVWLMKAVVVAAFIASLFLWVLLFRRLARWRYLPALALGTEAVLLAAFAISGEVLSPLAGADSPATILVALTAVFAMSLQNVAMAQIFHQHVPTTVMTGNFTRFTISVIDIFRPGRFDVRKDEAAVFKTRAQLRHYLFVLLAFTAGGVVGAAGFFAAGFPVLAFPAMILCLLALLLWRRQHTATILPQNQE